MNQTPTPTWIESDNDIIGPLLTISPMSAGVSVEIPLELFESLGAAVDTADGALSLRSSIRSMSEIFAALLEIGTKGLASIATKELEAAK